MKKILSILAAVAALASVVATAQAQTIISVQYQTNGSPLISAGTPATAGVVSVGNWNVAPLGYVTGTSTPLPALVDSNNIATGITGTTASLGGYDSGTGMGFVNTTGDYKLFRGYALGNYGGFTNISLTLSGLNTADSYSLITYVSNSDTGGTVLAGSINFAGAPTYYLKAESGNGAYTQGLATTSGAAVNGNYFKWTGITGTSSVVFSLPAAGGLTELYGFQLVETAVPEPSTWAMMLGGLGMLVAGQRMRRSRKS